MVATCYDKHGVRVVSERAHVSLENGRLEQRRMSSAY